ncbi:MAG: hypothetical protein ABIY52_16700 [Gemmatimonadaceae bacterium]
MKALRRPSSLVAVLVLSAAIALPSLARAQASRTRGPGPDTRRVLVTTFRGDPDAGVKAANEIRDRIESEFSIRELMPTSKKNIDTSLVGSGYKPDSALSPNDIQALARMVRGDEIIDGTVVKSGAAYRITARMFLPRDVAMSQPLVTNMETNNFGDAAKTIVKEYDQARKQIKDNGECENGIRAGKLNDAIAAARKGIQNYPKSTLLRLCLAQAYVSMKATADSVRPWKDSVLAVTKEVLALDKGSVIAWRLQVDAYKSTKDTANLVGALLGYMASDPTNATLREQVIAEVIALGRADLAVPIAKQLVAENPGDPNYARLLWLVERAAKQWKDAVAAGIAYAAMDTAVADSGYFDRQIEDLNADSSYAKVAEMAAMAAAKYPKSTSYLLQKAQAERRSGQLPAAKASLERALALDPKVNGANYLLGQIAVDMGQVDDAIKYAKADLATSPANKDRAATLLLSMGKKQYEVGTASKKADDYKKALPILQAADEISPSPTSKFLLAVSAFQAMYANYESLKTSHSCEDFKQANDLLTIVNINMGPGGSVDANTAKQIMGVAMQFGPFFDAAIKKYCK